MKRRGKSKAKPAANPKPNPARAKAVLNRQPRSAPQLWRLRLLGSLGVPLVLVALMELSLRIAGFGYPTAFLLESSHEEHQTLVQNNQFGWRFFGPRMSRLPHPISISQPKEPDVYRIFVFGESAAYGDPQPRFGLSRMLEAMLSLRYPGTKFEVVNAAMTGINSHAILPIVRDCAAAEGDLWVIYMGNNEVVGPFGAGTVFGAQAPPLSIIRAGLALKTWHAGQLLDWALHLIQKPPPEKSEWGGMLMFLDQQVRADDPRMVKVYSNFENNLEDILSAGRRHHAKIVLSTVAVNLRDCAPFASAHRSGLIVEEKRQWDQLLKLGTEDHQANRIKAAAQQFQKAAQLDDTYAELRFRQGQCALALGQISEAQRQFSGARDLDTLRFRCDSRINKLIRQASAKQNRANVLLADAEQAFADQSSDALPGQDLFYEHVHLTFEGNYLLARTIAAQAEKLLPAGIAKDASTTRPWPSLADCSRRLAWNRLESRMAFNEMLVRVADPPFTAQFNHDRMIEHLATASQAPSPTNSMEETAVSLQACEQASAALPDDPFLLKELASLRESAGDLTGAATAIQGALLLLPTSSDSWALCGLILARQQRFEDAAAAFRREFELDSQDVSALENLALCLVKQNRREQAIREYRRAVRIKPRYGPAWLGLGQALEGLGRKEEATACYRKGLENRVHRSSDLATLARFCANRGWHDAAATNYAEALKLSPTDATLSFEAGQNLGALGHHREAAQLYANAAALAPGWAQAQFQCGLELGQSGQPAEASIRFKEATRLMPELMEARLNLAIALTNQKRYREAISEFEQVIQHSPTNAIAAQYLQALRKKVSTEPGG